MSRLLVSALLLAVLATAVDPLAGIRMKSQVLHAHMQQAKMEVEAANKLMEGKPKPPQLQDRLLTSLRPVENQGGCGSCVAFGTTHAIQDLFRYCGLPRLATQHILDCKLSCASGGYITAAYDMFNWPGITTESCKRYRAADGACAHYGGFLFGWGKYHVTYCDSGARASSFFRAWGTTCSKNHNTLVSWIDTGKPFTFGLRLMRKFYDHGNAVVARDSIYPRSTGPTDIIGGHAMEIVGYGTMGGVPYWTVKNSWGSGWGDGGFFKLRRNPYNGALAAFGIWEYFFDACRPLYYGCTGMKGLDADTNMKVEAFQPTGAEFHIQADSDDDAATTGELQNNSTGQSRNPQPGSSGPVSKNDPLVKEAAYFSVHVLLAAMTQDGGYQCLPPLTIREDQNASIAGASIQEISVMSEVTEANTQITVYSADQRIVGGISMHVLFSFTNSDPRCAAQNPGGVFDTTVYISQDGYLIMQRIFPSDKPEEDEVPVGAIVGGSVAAFVVVAGVITFLAVRHHRTKKQYAKLEATHKEIQHRVTVLENGANGAVFREAALSKLLQEGAAPSAASGPAVTLHMKSDTSSTSSV